ncbi:MAG: chromate efflux transporter [Acidimicrobiales bacterium]|jgi:chromate transporter
MPEPAHESVPFSTLIREWGRIGLIGFGGPPAHIALFRRLCVEDREWLTADDFEDGIAATSLLPGPASTQLAIYCAWRLRGRLGAVVGGICFILPGLTIILALSALFLSAHPPLWVLGAAAGAGAAVPVVALNAAAGLLPASWHRSGTEPAGKVRWILYFLAGGISAATIGPFLVLVLIVCGVTEIVIRTPRTERGRPGAPGLLPVAVLPVVTGGVAALCWMAFKVGALSYGGGFVIIPLMQHDVVVTYHWMSGAQFLNAVALGQVTPGPVVQTVAVVGYAASGLWGGVLAAAVAFAPSFAFVIAGAGHFDRLRTDRRVQAFFLGAGAAVVGAIAGSAIPLGLEISHLWQLGVTALAAVWLLALRRGVVAALIGAGVVGVVAVLIGAPS